MATQYIRCALARLCDDKNGFLYSKRGRDVGEAATRLLNLVKEERNEEVFEHFSKELISTIQSCLTKTKRRKASTVRENSQVKFHKIRLTILPEKWRKFEVIVGVSRLDPLLSQSVNDHIFKASLVEKLSEEAPVTPLCPSSQLHLTREEENALRYACGYIPMKLMRKYEKQSTDKAAQFVECLSHLAVSGQESSFGEYTTEWHTKVNCGGLFSVSDEAYQFFYAVECQVRKRLPQHLRSQIGSKSELIRAILDDVVVQFFWSMLVTDIEQEDDSDELLEEVIELWVTIHGFSTASSWLEQYKATVKTATKKKKGLRKTLHRLNRQVTKDMHVLRVTTELLFDNRIIM